MRRSSLILFLLGAIAPVNAQAPDSRLSLDRIFASGDFRGDAVSPVHWLNGGSFVTLRPSKSHTGAMDIVRVGKAGNGEVIVPSAKLIPPKSHDPLAIDRYDLSNDLDLVLIYTNSRKVWRQNTRGDYWTFRRSTGTLAKIGRDAKPSTLMFAKLSPDGSRVGYVRDNNLYVEPAGGGHATQLTNDGSHDVINGTFDWVYEEEFDCRDGWRWSPDGRQIAYWQIDTRGVKTFALIDDTTSTYPILKTFPYPKSGERNSACRVGVVSASGGTTTWMAVPGDTRTDYYIPRMEWAGNPNELAIRRVNRLQNAVDVMVANATTGIVRKVLTDRDGAWIDVHDDAMDWVDKENSFSWISERDGWRHLYFVSRDGATTHRITSGEYDVIKVLRIDEKGGFVYLLASPENPTQQYLYQVPISGIGPPQRLSPADRPGWHDYDLSPDGVYAVHTYSMFGQPARVEVISLPDHKVVRTLATNDKLRKSLGELAPCPVEFFRAEAGGGVQLDGWLMKPTHFDPAKKYPLLFYVYGEPASQSVTDQWGGTNYLWHRMLAEQGYAVACVDNRGTPCPRGRDWRKVVYRRIGTLASNDQAAAAKALLKRPYLDPARVGVWGWSGGGSMTLNLLFRHPNVYRTGMAVAPVPDIHLYDTIYQERYMGLPQVNAEDYNKSSPITYAAGLKGNLLIVHGTGDDNVHYQGTEKLVNRLVELDKPFSMMAYPNRTHAINEGKNTTRHLYGLLTQYLHNNLPAGSPR